MEAVPNAALTLIIIFRERKAKIWALRGRRGRSRSCNIILWPRPFKPENLRIKKKIQAANGKNMRFTSASTVFVIFNVNVKLHDIFCPSERKQPRMLTVLAWDPALLFSQYDKFKNQLLLNAVHFLTCWQSSFLNFLLLTRSYEIWINCPFSQKWNYV